IRRSMIEEAEQRLAKRSAQTGSFRESFLRGMGRQALKRMRREQVVARPGEPYRLLRKLDWTFFYSAAFCGVVAIVSPDLIPFLKSLALWWVVWFAAQTAFGMIVWAISTKRAADA
ncbi:MAG: hypothetical protein JWQ02_3828, partial [Capsulimonas sp.]|nr:hypothetical protein [Capsulimonas sp.]